MKGIIRAMLVLITGLAFGSMLASRCQAETYLYIAHAASGRNVSASANPAFPVDISANGVCISKGLSFGEITGPFSGTGGTYTFAISAANTGAPCSSPAVYTVTATLNDSSTYFGILTLDSANAVTGQLYAVDLSSIAKGMSRVVIANATDQNLTASLKNHEGGQQNASINIAAESMEEATTWSGRYSGSIWLEGSSTSEAGPASVDLMSRDLYFYVLAGSASNGSVQLIGPKVIRDVF
jgi:hypothetical protein